MDQNGNARERPSEAVQDEILASILQKIGRGADDGAKESSAPSALNTSSSNSGSSSQIGDVFSSLLSNPEILTKLPSIIASVKPIIEMLGKAGSATVATATSGDTKEPSNESTSISAAKLKESSSSQKGADSRTALLCAMKPYLSEGRREAVDYIIKLSRLGDILKTL